MVHTSAVRPSAATDAAAGQVPSIVGGSTEFGVLSDVNVSTFIAIPGAAGQFSTRRYPLADLSGVPSDAMIDYVLGAATWAMTGSGQLHFALRMSVSNVEYPDTTGNGPNGDYWIGSYVALDTRLAAKRGLTPAGTPWTIADINNLKLAYHLFPDNGSGGMWLTDIAAYVYWYAAPTISGSGAPMPDPAKFRVTWSFSGDGVTQSKYIVKVFSDSTYNGPSFNPATSRWIYSSGVVDSSANTFTYDAPADGNYHVFVWAAAVLPVSQREQWTGTPLHIVATFDRSPNAPTLVSPSSGAHFDSGLGVTFGWTFSHPDSAVTQGGWQLELQTDSGAALYWNETTGTWVGSAVTNPGAAATKTFPAGAISSGHTYTWRVRTTDADGDLSPWSSPSVFIGDSPPSVSLNEPTGTQTTTDAPGIAWTFTDPNGDPQELYDLRIFTAAAAAAPGFDPVIAVPVWSSGIVASATDRSITSIGIDLPNATAYTLFGRVSSRGMWSSWATTDFNVALATPAAPLVVCASDADASRVLVSVQARDNLLTLQDSSFGDPANVGTWLTSTGLSSMTFDTAVAKTGVGSLKLVASGTGSGNAGCANSAGTVYAPVLAGDVYSAIAQAYAPSSGDQCAVSVTIRWWSAAKAFISAVTGSTVNTVAGQWRQAKVTATAPAGAAFASIVFNVGAGTTGRVVNVDEVGLMPTDVATWAAGGFIATRQILVEFSDDLGGTWQALRGGGALTADAHHAVAIYDYEVPPSFARLYRARSVGVVSNQRLASDPSPVQGAAGTSKTWWLKDPLQPSRNMPVRVLPDLTASTELSATPFETKGSNKAVVIGEDEERGETIRSVSLWALDFATHVSILRLLRSGRVLLLQDVIAQQWYVRAITSLERERVRSQDPITGTGHTHKIHVTFAEVDRPDGDPVEDTTP